ncbi:MAG: shikimate dehydrogenase [Desulfovibrio sp.]|jgi:shikimate dehydrogenase|nr:shikimate dehydrogenase [Desulfovibrio sp.]
MNARQGCGAEVRPGGECVSSGDARVSSGDARISPGGARVSPGDARISPGDGGARPGGAPGFPLKPRHIYGILGDRLGHSLSPAFHNLAFARAGYPGVYCLFERQKESLPEFFRAARALPLAGLSVTIPHKEHVLPFLDRLSDRARLAGAVNTVLFAAEGVLGDNTDIAGFLSPLRDYAAKMKFPDEALVLGAGGAARAVLAGLLELGFAKVSVAARRPEKARELLAALPWEKTTRIFALAWEDRVSALSGREGVLVVNATPLGMQGVHPGANPLPDEAFALLCRKEGENLAGADKAAPSLVYDLVYAPRLTPFLAAARERGLACLDGTGFFVAQAAAQFCLWTGLELSLADAGRILEEYGIK